MPTSGLVITIDESSSIDEIFERLREDPRLEIGQHVSRRTAVVATTQSTDDDKALWCWLHNLPGVQRVDVVFVDFSDTH